MAIVKVTKSKKAIMFVDEEGNVFMTSKVAIQNMLNGNIKGDFVLLSRMPFTIAQDRFKPSPLYKPEGYVAPEGDEVKNNNDAISQNTLKANKEKKQYKDVKVW